jgi:hypothetical protein
MLRVQGPRSVLVPSLVARAAEQRAAAGSAELGEVGREPPKTPLAAATATRAPPGSHGRGSASAMTHGPRSRLRAKRSCPPHAMRHYFFRDLLTPFALLIARAFFTSSASVVS